MTTSDKVRSVEVSSGQIKFGLTLVRSGHVRSGQFRLGHVSAVQFRSR